MRMRAHARLCIQCHRFIGIIFYDFQDIRKVTSLRFPSRGLGEVSSGSTRQAFMPHANCPGKVLHLLWGPTLWAAACFSLRLCDGPFPCLSAPPLDRWARIRRNPVLSTLLGAWQLCRNVWQGGIQVSEVGRPRTAQLIRFIDDGGLQGSHGAGSHGQRQVSEPRGALVWFLLIAASRLFDLGWMDTINLWVSCL